MKERAAVKLAFLDACRDNPYAADLQRSMGKLNRSVSAERGLAPMRLGDGELDTALVFAALPEKRPQTETARNSPFTRAICEISARPGQRSTTC